MLINPTGHDTIEQFVFAVLFSFSFPLFQNPNEYEWVKNKFLKGN